MILWEQVIWAWFFRKSISCNFTFLLLYTHNHDNTTKKKDEQKLLYKSICTSHFIVRVRKGYSRFACERELETKHNCNILTPTLMAVSVVSFSFSRAAQPKAQGLSFLHHILLATGLRNYWGPRGPLWPRVAFPTTSYQQLLWTPIHQGLQGPLRPGVAFPTTPRLLLQLISNFLSWLSYIIVQRPLNRPLNLWNSMFDRHQAEITVMQFTGHSLPVHQSMSVPWDFFCLVSFHQPNPAYEISFDYWPLGCVISFRCITLEWHICLGRSSKYNNITSVPPCVLKILK